LALKEGLDPADIQAIREGGLPKDNKLAALSVLARTMIEKRGRLDNEDVDRFIAAGFGKDHALEVIAIVAASTITNYSGSVTKTHWRRYFSLMPGPIEVSNTRHVLSINVIYLVDGPTSIVSSPPMRGTATAWLPCLSGGNRYAGTIDISPQQHRRRTPLTPTPSSTRAPRDRQSAPEGDRFQVQ
jgi:hypothetical protein